MFYIVVDGVKFEIEGEELHQTLLQTGLPKMQEALDEMGGSAKMMVGSSLGAVLGLLGMQKPKELRSMDNVEYAVRLAISMLLETAEGQTLELPNAKVVKEVAEDE